MRSKWDSLCRLLVLWQAPQRERVQTRPFNEQRLREVLKIYQRKQTNFPAIPMTMKYITWELMKCQTHIRKLELELKKLKQNSGRKR